MIEPGETTQNEAINESLTNFSEAPYRSIQYGRIYDKLKPNQKVNVAIIGNVTMEIDEENLGLDRISITNLQKGWETDKDWFTKYTKELGIDFNPFEMYKYYHIQRKVFQVLGQSIQDVTGRNNRFNELGERLKLSDTKGYAMCSEYAILSAYIAQKIGEPVHLIIGSATDAHDNDKWREAHAYVWVDSLNAIFDSVLAQSDSEYPALMKPVTPATLMALEKGFDVQATRVGSNITRFYGLEAGGFGVRMDHPPNTEK